MITTHGHTPNSTKGIKPEAEGLGCDSKTHGVELKCRPNPEVKPRVLDVIFAQPEKVLVSQPKPDAGV